MGSRGRGYNRSDVTPARERATKSARETLSGKSSTIPNRDADAGRGHSAATPRYCSLLLVPP